MMQLVGTPLSHFTRKVRIVAAELSIPLDFQTLPATTGVMTDTPDAYASNPLMRVPVLVDGETRLVESDHIVRYLVGKFDPADRLGVKNESPDALNRLAVLNGVMDNEVVLILAKRGGLDGIENVVYFKKLIAAIDGALAWLDARTDPDAPGFDYRDITTICMWQHIGYYSLRPLDAYGRLAARVAKFAKRPSVVPSTPVKLRT
ncbi:MAG: glutathione S-transferase family protein [Deltaproteobacteria bacterium]|nr:glutathione S-transferase family protein [Deltaproteobacteria bacterium]